MLLSHYCIANCYLGVGGCCCFIALPTVKGKSFLLAKKLKNREFAEVVMADKARNPRKQR